MAKLKQTLRRYTDLASLLYMLRRRCITLLDPTLWDDTNDSYYLKVYKEFRKAPTILALCFSESSETYHQWRVFAGGPSGVCVQFQRKSLLTALPPLAIQKSSVQYRKLRDLAAPHLLPKDLPFVKRYAFAGEEEFRLIYESQTVEETKDIPISLTTITRVTLSPWMPKALAGEVKKVIKAVPGCDKLAVAVSTLTSNQQWKRAGDQALARWNGR